MNLLIAGGGKFGKRAINFAKKLNYNTILIDKDPNCYASSLISKKYNDLDSLLRDFHNENSTEIIFLNEDIGIIYDLLLNIKFEYIIPVVPIHLTALIIKLCFNSFNCSLTPNSSIIESYKKRIKPELYLHDNMESGVVYLSYAKKDEICPEDCPGPPNFCPTFEREKPITVINYVKELFNVKNNITISINENTAKFLIESYQLMAGLGGVKGNDIYELITSIQEKEEYFQSKLFDIVVATSCNCHGVISFFENKPF